MWHESLDDDATLEDSLQLSLTTVLSRSVRMYEDTVVKLRALTNNYTEVCGLFDIPVAQDLVAMAQDTRHGLMIPHSEGLLSTLFRSRYEAIPLKNKVLAVKNLIKTDWEKVEPRILARAKDALRLR